MNPWRRLGRVNGEEVYIFVATENSMMLTTDHETVEMVRQQSLLEYGARDPRTQPKLTPIYAQPRNTALDFIHTDYVAHLLKTRQAQYTSPCTDICLKSQTPCRIHVAAIIQLKVGNDAASIVGDYLAGKGWPGTDHDMPFAEWLRLCSCAEPPFYCCCFFCR